jgi:hypothetical protein
MTALDPPPLARDPTILWRAFQRMLIAAIAVWPVFALATVYTFSGSSYPACSSGSWSLSGSTYTCNGSFTLASGDSISPASTITVLSKAGITLGGGNTVGSSSVTVDLQTQWGSLSSSGSGTTLWGSLTTSSGAINLTGTTVNGAVTTSGTATFNGGSVTGNVSASNGITSTNGTSFGGNVAASNGSVSLSGGSVAGSVSSTCCSVTLNNTNVANGVSSSSNTVTINGGTIAGAISTSGGGGITINNATVTSGSVITSNVAITISGSTLGSASNPVNVSSNNTVTISNSTVYGNVTAGSWSSALTIDASSTIYGVCSSNTNSNVSPGNYGYRCQGAPPASATCNTGTISGIVNSYYPGTANVSTGATTLSVGSRSGASTGLAAGDLILVMQMQDATIDTTNSSSYGSTSTINAGKYEYATVASVSGSTVTLSSGLTNAYTTAAYGAAGQKTFQVIRVPVYSSATLGSATAKAWDGSTGGVLAFDVTGTLTLNNATADVSGKGFRGGGGCLWVGDDETSGLSASDYRRNASTTCPSSSRNDGRANGLKAEGIAGTPRYVYDGSSRVNTSAEGYPNGSTGRGAPANAGGGGTDDHPSANDENTGGGGGGNGGAGGMGGYGWNASSSPGRGLGGAALTSSASRIYMGGGGGAGTSNNGTSDGNGLNSSGVAGGGIIMVRASSLSGTGSFVADGTNNTLSVDNDGSGGGGAGGSVLVYAGSGLSNLSISAKGGTGGSNTGGGAYHGPGGGGGGGYVISTSSLHACTVSGGASGTTYQSNTYGAAAGSTGQCVTGLAVSQTSGATLGSGPCTVPLHHYAISYPNGNPGVTCETLAVRITGHSSSDTEVAPAAGTQITLSTSPAADGWALKSGNGSFTTPNKYAFDGTETYVDFWLTRTTPTTSPHIDIDVTDGLRTDNDGNATEDAKAQFDDTVFKYYTCTGAVPATCSAATIGNQIAGKTSNLAPGAQNLYLRAVKTDGTTGACAGGLSGSQSIGFGYECDMPTACASNDLMSLNGGTATTIARNADNTISASTGNYSDVTLVFDANGYAPFTLNYSDAGYVTLHARKTLTAGSGTPPSTAATIYGASNSFAVRPFALDLSVTGNPKATAYNGTAFLAAGEDFAATVRGVVWQAADDANNDGLPDAGANLADNAATPNFAWATTLAASGAAGSYTPLDTAGGVAGTLSPSPAALAKASFSGGSATTSGQTPAFALTWSEVGSFTLTASADDYLGVSVFDLSGSTVVGRFKPHHFGIDGKVVTRSDRQISETQGTPFTYMDEPMRLILTVTAYNKGDGITKNYLGSFAKLNASDLGTSLPAWQCASGGPCMGLTATSGSNLSSRLALDTTSPNSANPDNTTTEAGATTGWSNGKSYFKLNLVFDRNATPDGPYSTLKFGGQPVDTEGVTLPPRLSSDTTHCVNLDITIGTEDATCDNAPGGQLSATAANLRRKLFETDVRFGRLWLGNAYGSDQRDLSLPFEAQYWNGYAFVKNTKDSLTRIAIANIGLQQNGLNSTVSGGPFTTSSGAGSFILTAPTGTPNTGGVDIVFDLGDTPAVNATITPTLGPTAGAQQSYLRSKWSGSNYDRDPTARATFGVQPGKRGPIYIRENY